MSSTSPVRFIGKMFQKAYVTNDVDQAVAVFAERYGVPKFRVGRNIAVDIVVPGKRSLVSHYALAWVGDIQHEIIEPVSGADEVYGDWVSGSAFRLGIHHIGYEVVGTRAEWDAFATELGQTKQFALQAAAHFPMQFIYTDERPYLGHFHEYNWFGDNRTAKETFADLPRAP